jgi:addiction module HigA family antidote
MPVQLHSSIFGHVGDWLKTEIIEPHGFNVTRAADHLKVSRQQMSALLNGRAGLSADMAICFEKAFGVKADTLMRMQTAYDLAQARKHADELNVEPV